MTYLDKSISRPEHYQCAHLIPDLLLIQKTVLDGSEPTKEGSTEISAQHYFVVFALAA